ncbi:MAG: hypothetical protein ACPIFQ_03160 [Candidatus Puniceispirillaceae bacterium]|jgi:hypothetical protein
MAQSRNMKIRDLRKRGKSKLVRVNDQLNSIAWEIFERNSSLNDVNATRAVAVLDDALSLIQRAGALLNSVHVEDDPNTAGDPNPQGFVGSRGEKPEAGKGKATLSRSVSSVN